MTHGRHLNDPKVAGVGDQQTISHPLSAPLETQQPHYQLFISNPSKLAYLRPPDRLATNTRVLRHVL